MKRVLGAATLVLLGCVALIAFLNLGRWLSAADPVARVDFVLVPAGDPEDRVRVALSLVEQDLAREAWILVQPPGPVLREEAAILSYAERRGLDESVKVIGSARSMMHGALIVADRLDADEGSSIRIGVVSSPWTLARARLTFGRLLGQRVEMSAWPDDRVYDADRWWQHDASTTFLEALEFGWTLLLFGDRPLTEADPVPTGVPLRAALAGLLAAAAIGLACRWAATRLGLVAQPRLFRAHDYPVPLLGGMAILGGLATGMVASRVLELGTAGTVAAGGVVALALVGFIDDLVGLGARSRLLWAAAAGAAVWFLGLRAQVFFDGTIAQVGNAAVTILWFVGITHALNILDNLDGAAAGVAAISAATIAGVGFVAGQWLVTAGAAALAGACVGYLVHNMHPARLFMGDLGALGVGFALAVLGMGMRPAQEPPLSLAVAALALGVPIFDTVLVTTSRLIERRPVGVGGTDHTVHRLIARGWSPRRAAGLLWAIQGVLGVGAFAVAGSGRATAWILTGLFSALGLVALVRFLRLPSWKPPTTTPESAELLRAIEGVAAPLRTLLERARQSGLDVSDPTAFRSLKQTLNYLEVRRRLLSEDRVETN